MCVILETAQVKPRRIAFLLDNLNGGGAERVVFGIASGFSDLGYEVDLLVFELRGDLCDSIPDGVNLVVLEPVQKLAGLYSAFWSAGWKGLGGILYWLASARKVPKFPLHPFSQRLPAGKEARSTFGRPA